MRYILKNKEIELTAEEVAEIVKQNQTPVEEKKVGVVINTIFGGVKFQSTKTTLREAILEKYNIDADLRNADLRNADLSNANLRNADLRNADLRNADLSNADLSDADLRNANLRNVELNCAKFYGRGGTKPLKRSQLPSFLGALGFIIEEDN